MFGARFAKFTHLEIVVNVKPALTSESENANILMNERLSKRSNY
jgi:hypothetical protein